MTSESTSSVPATPLESAPAKPRPKRKGMSQERFMIMFTLFFIAGVLLLVVFPEGSPARGVSLTVYSVFVFWAMFRFGI
jgi:hypothetical protein